jgi:uncharacterized protein
VICITEETIKEILSKSRVIAVVGLSMDETKPSYQVAAYMKKHGYRIVPINPFVDQVFGEKSYNSLLDLPNDLKYAIDVVDIFRRPADVMPIVEQAIQLRSTYGKPSVVWMQLGIVNEEAAELARKAGLTIIMDRCLIIEHRHFFGF